MGSIKQGESSEEVGLVRQVCTKMDELDSSECSTDRSNIPLLVRIIREVTLRQKNSEESKTGGISKNTFPPIESGKPEMQLTQTGSLTKYDLPKDGSGESIDLCTVNSDTGPFMNCQDDHHGTVNSDPGKLQGCHGHNGSVNSDTGMNCHNLHCTVNSDSGKVKIVAASNILLT